MTTLYRVEWISRYELMACRYFKTQPQAEGFVALLEAEGYAATWEMHTNDAARPFPETNPATQVGFGPGGRDL